MILAFSPSLSSTIANFCHFVHLLEHFDGSLEELYWKISSVFFKLCFLVRNDHTYMNKTIVSGHLLHTVNSDFFPLIFSSVRCIFSFFKKCWL